MGKSALIPDAIRSGLGYTSFNPRGDGSQERDFIYVEDVIELYLSMAEALSLEPNKYLGEVFNAGTNTVHTVKSVIEKIYDLINNKPGLEKIKKDMVGKKTVGEIECQYMDYVKVNEFFNWEPKYNFNDGLIKTINWFQDYLKKDL